MNETMRDRLIEAYHFWASRQNASSQMMKCMQVRRQIEEMYAITKVVATFQRDRDSEKLLKAIEGCRVTQEMRNHGDNI